MKYFNFITFYIMWWNISNVVKFVHELVCNSQVKLSVLLIDV